MCVPIPEFSLLQGGEFWYFFIPIILSWGRSQGKGFWLLCFFFPRKCQNSHPLLAWLPPLSLWLNIDKCINYHSFDFCASFRPHSKLYKVKNANWCKFHSTTSKTPKSSSFELLEDFFELLLDFSDFLLFFGFTWKENRIRGKSRQVNYKIRERHLSTLSCKQLPLLPQSFHYRKQWLLILLSST